MARLRDVPQVFRRVGAVAFARRVWKQGSDDEIMTWASALAYSWLFAVFPFFVFLMTFVPALPDKTRNTVTTELKNVVYTFPKEAANTIWTTVEPQLKQLLEPQTGHLILRITGLVLALWAASSGMSTTMAALDRCYALRESRPFYKQRLLALMMTIVIATLILLVLLLLPVGGIVKAFVIRQNWPGFGRGSPAVIAFDIIRWVLAVPFMISILTALYHFGPNVRHRFHWITPGAVFSILVWIALGFAFNFYLDHFANYNKTYGTVGGAAVILLVFYMDAAVLLWGAEINSEIDFEILNIERGTRDLLPAEVETEMPADTKST